MEIEKRSHHERTVLAFWRRPLYATGERALACNTHRDRESVSPRKNLKNRILKIIRDAIDVFNALEALMLKVFSFGALMYLLFRIIQ
jgi:hypothetical protein